MFTSEEQRKNFHFFYPFRTYYWATGLPWRNIDLEALTDFHAAASAEARVPHAAPRVFYFQRKGFVNLLGIRQFMRCVNVLRGSSKESYT